MSMERGVKDFLGKPAPPGYIAGLGRGATGFITRPDLGPGSNVSAPAASILPKAIREEDNFEDNENEEGLLAARGPLGADDEEADTIFSMIDAKMDQRRKNRKVKPAQTSEGRSNDPTTMFAAEKLKLRQVSATEWAQLPESGDFIAKRAKKTNEKERYTPVPDSVLLGGNISLTAMEDSETDFRSIGETREKVLGARLDMATTNSTSTTSIDPAGYLTSLNEHASAASRVHDIKRARILLKSAILSNPSNPSAWISAAKIEEVSQNSKIARSIIMDAIEACPESEDIWIEAIRLALPQDTPSLVEKALMRLPKSVNLWLFASDREREPLSAKRILRRALEENPNSPALWKSIVDKEEDEQDARALLAKAVECCPNSVELWIALARLETHENARKILNKARQQNPTSVTVWIAAAKLEEAYGNEGDIVQKIINRAIFELNDNGAMMDRASWIAEAISCERTGDIICASSITKSVSFLGLNEEKDDIKAILFSEAKAAFKKQSKVVPRTLLEIILEKFSFEETTWLEIINIQKNEEPETVIPFCENAVKNCPYSSELWLIYSSLSSDPLKVLEAAISNNPQSEDLWVALCKKAKQAGSSKLPSYLARARECVKNDLIWKMSIIHELHFNGIESALALATRAIENFKNSEKIWLTIGRINPQRWDEALQACPLSSKICIESASYFSAIQPMKSRAILEKARLSISNDPQIWLASIKLESSLDAVSQARSLLSKGLQKFPYSDLLWYEAISMESRPLKKAKAMDALRSCPNSPLAFLAIGEVMEYSRNLPAASEYYERALMLDKNIGDIWARLICFYRRSDQLDKSNSLLSQALELQPKDGPTWKEFRKNPKRAGKGFSDCFMEFLDSFN